jgi:two-component system sensor histidine kinase AlgZ
MKSSELWNYIVMPQTQPASLPVEIVIPDCCNIGVVMRALLAVNGIVLAAILARSSAWTAGINEFVELSILLEPACLSSLLVLCGLRRIVRTIPAWGQRVVSALAPAAVTGLVGRLIMSNELMLASFTQRSVVASMSVAALFGLALQHYYELRTRAFSPALAEARLQALQARIRPHFLYNSLNAVLSMIRSELNPRWKTWPTCSAC